MRKTTELLIASYNIHKGVGTDRRRDLRRTTAVLAEIDAEIIALQEADHRFGDRAGLLELEALRMDLQLVHEPVPGGGASHGWHGNLLLVRAGAIQEVHHMALPGLEPRGAIITDLSIKGHALRVIAAHFGLLPSSRRVQVRAILNRIADLDPRPTVLMGDLNEWRSGTGSSLAQLDDHFRPSQAPRSFPSRYPLLALDRIMAGHKARVTGLEVHDTPLARRASDHLPIKALLHLPPAEHIGGSPA